MIDQARTGAFISTRRKDKGLTQVQLAERLGITDRAVSKWERGLCLPDASLMIPLCQILGISVNELLLGQYSEDGGSQRRSDELIVELRGREEETNRRLMRIEKTVGALAVVAFLALLLIAVFVASAFSTAIGTVIGIAAFAILLGGVIQALAIETYTGWYECAHCHKRYVPGFSRVFIAPHIGTTRYMKCPSCGRRSWQKKVLAD